VTENKSTIWYTTIEVQQGILRAKVAPLTNALKGHSIKLESPVPPFGGAGDFDISKNGIVFVAKDPRLDPANHTKTDLYYIPLRTFTEPQAPSPQIIKTGNLKGYSQSPVFAPDAKSVVFSRMRSDQYESDKPRLLLVPDLTDLSNVQEFYETEDGEGKWDLRPEGIAFSKNGLELYVTAEENGRGKLFKLPSSPRYATDLPIAIVNDGTVSDAKSLPDGRLLISSNSLIDSSIFSIIDPSEPSKISTISSVSKSGKAFGLSQDQIDEFWYEGAEDYSVHAWVLKPSNFDKSKKYPLAYLIHGGVSLQASSLYKCILIIDSPKELGTKAGLLAGIRPFSPNKGMSLSHLIRQARQATEWPFRTALGTTGAAARTLTSSRDLNISKPTFRTSIPHELLLLVLAMVAIW
jgi:dipeptidyl aminopeptidase/acylaminoacyl peptidase